LPDNLPVVPAKATPVIKIINKDMDKIFLAFRKLIASKVPKLNMFFSK
jgi:hypothetical protein